MTISVSPTEDEMTGAVCTVLATFLPSTVEIVVGQVNRVPEPSSPDFIVMWFLTKPRLSTNIDEWADAKFIGSITSTTLTISDVDFGSLRVGSPVYGVGVTLGTSITALGTGTGGVGTYTINNAQTISSQVIAAGTTNVLMPSEVRIQMDVHGPNSNDYSTMITALFRDDYAVQAFKATAVDLSPLYADDPKQIPFINAENQYENRWVVEAKLQANLRVLDIPQQYSDTAVVGIINVDAVYPP